MHKRKSGSNPHSLPLYSRLIIDDLNLIKIEFRFQILAMIRRTNQKRLKSAPRLRLKYAEAATEKIRKIALPKNICWGHPLVSK